MGPGCFYPGNATAQVDVPPHWLASMGPGCFYPGNLAMERALRAVDAASMGPGCFYPGNPDHRARALLLDLASMGPGCFYPGNKEPAGTPREACKLQWGRDVSIPEITPRYRRDAGARCFNGAGMFLSRKY